MDAPVPASQHLVGAAASLEVTWNDEHGEAAAASGAVTVRVQKADGTDVVTAGSSTTAGEGTGQYDRAITAAQNTTLNLLTATWTDAGNSATRSTLHEIVGGFYFTAADARAFDTAISPQLATNDRVRAVRREVEAECELITGVAWVPRYRRVLASGNGDTSIVLPSGSIRSVRSVRVYSNPTTYTAFTATELAAVTVFDDGTITRTDGNVFVDGDQNVVVEYEHGRDRPPPELLHATLTRLRSRLKMETTGIPDRATSFVMAEGGAFRLAQPGLYTTGIPDVDAVYQRYSIRRTRVAGRVIDYDPTRTSLFHGGRR